MKSIFSVFEYDSLEVNSKSIDGGLFTKDHRTALEHFYYKSKTKYFDLIRNGVKFCNYVGVIQVGNLQIEILPKIDKSNDSEKKQWRNILIDMLRATGMFKVTAPSYGMLKLRNNSILELYFAIFLGELEYLIRTGLFKQYKKQEINQLALKGALDFPKHLSKNIVHQERFYTNTNVYNYDHIWHWIFFQTLKLIKNYSQKRAILDRVSSIELNFPEVTNQQISVSTFSRLHYTRKSQSYKNAIDIAQLLFSNLHPDLQAGKNSVLALMFDMNLLWERVIYSSLAKMFRQYNNDYIVKAQHYMPFWKANNNHKDIKPDIVIQSPEGETFILDTKWKIGSDNSPDSSDLYQLFAYSQFFQAKRTALIYPGLSKNIVSSKYLMPNPLDGNPCCDLIQLEVQPKISDWQKTIYDEIWKWMNSQA